MVLGGWISVGFCGGWGSMGDAGCSVEVIISEDVSNFLVAVSSSNLTTSTFTSPSLLEVES